MEIGESEKARNRRRRQRILENPTRLVGAAATRRQRELDRQAAILETMRIAGARQIMRRFTRRYRPREFRLPANRLRFLLGENTTATDERFMTFMRRFGGMRVRVQYINGDGGIEVDRDAVEIGRVFDRSEKNEFVRNYLVEYNDGDPIILPIEDDFNGYLRIFTSAPPTGDFGEQLFQHGYTNCVLKHLDAWITSLKEGPNKKVMLKKMETTWAKYKDGVPETAIQGICDDLVIGITVLSPYSHKELINIEKEGVKRLRKKFTFINTRENHVELYDNMEYNIVSQEEMNDLFELKADGTIWEQTRDGIVYFMRDGTKEFRISDESKEVTDFKMSIQGFDVFKNEDLMEFVHKSLMRLGTVDNVTRSGDTVHIDQKNSYASFKSCPYYTGFPAFITDNIQSCDRIYGEGFYYVEEFVSLGEFAAIDKMLGGVFMNGNIYPANVLNMLSDKGGEYIITHGCWGTRTDIEFPDEMINDKSYQKFIGTLETTKRVNAVRVHNVDYNWLGQVEDLVASRGDIKEILIPKATCIYRGHLASYLIGYCACQTLNQLLNMDIDKVVRVCVDGIYTNEADVKLTGSFRFKEAQKFGNIAGGKYVSNVQTPIPEEQRFTWPDTASLFPHRVSLAYGPGGFGKSHYFKHNNPGAVETLFVNPSHELCAASPETPSVTHQKLLTNEVGKDGRPKWKEITKKHTELVFDEASMLTKKEYLKLVKRFPDHKLIFCGDLGFQLPPVSKDGEPVEELDEDDFEHTYEFKKDYRSKDRETREFKKIMRELIREGRGMLDIYEHLHKLTSVKKPVKLSEWREAELKKLKFEKANDDVESVIRSFIGDDFGYQVEDMIICSQHDYCAEYTEYFKDKPKYKVTENTPKFQNGNILFEKPNLPANCYEFRHGYTVHGSQGKTLSRRLFIDVRKMKSRRMLYTALSRVNKLSQIVLINGV